MNNAVIQPQAGFTAIDVFWMQAGHAIFGGRKPNTHSITQ